MDNSIIEQIKEYPGGYGASKQCDYFKLELYNGKTIEENNISCLEIVKQNYLKNKKITIKKQTSKINEVFPISVQNWWLEEITKIPNFRSKFKYTIDDKYHTIEMNFADFNGMGDFYICLILLRYLWYYNFNGFIKHILLMLNEGFSFNYAIITSALYHKEGFHYYNLLPFGIVPKYDIFNSQFEYFVNQYTNDNYLHGAIMNKNELNNEYNKKLSNIVYSLLTGNYKEDKILISKYLEMNNPTTYEQLLQVLKKLNISVSRCTTAELKKFPNILITDFNQSNQSLIYVKMKDIDGYIDYKYKFRLDADPIKIHNIKEDNLFKIEKI